MFTARRYDDESELYYYRARMYNHQLGRFMQTDPIGYNDGMNIYAYCGNNSVSYTDPSGQWGIGQGGGHRQLTYKAMRGAGFSGFDSGLARDGSVATDTRNDHYPGGNDVPHFTPGTEVLARKHAQGALELAIQLELNGRHKDAMHMLGMGMHTMQDEFAHSRKNAGWLAHANPFNYPDTPHNDMELYMEAYKASKGYVNEFMMGVSEKQCDLNDSGGIGDGYIQDNPKSLIERIHGLLPSRFY